jgi:hypothetical protein
MRERARVPVILGSEISVGADQWATLEFEVELREDLWLREEGERHDVG